MKPKISSRHVLIESDWNLKERKGEDYKKFIAVLIESDWNLKFIYNHVRRNPGAGINRIRLEFKEQFA